MQPQTQAHARAHTPPTITHSFLSIKEQIGKKAFEKHDLHN